MSLFIEKETDTDFSFDEEALAKEVTDYAIEHEGFPFEAEINLTLTDNDGIHAINKEYRDIDAPTDVLSFPALCLLCTASWEPNQKHRSVLHLPFCQASVL